MGEGSIFCLCAQKKTFTNRCGKGLANNTMVANKAGVVRTRTDDFTVTATPL
jgi:hypothetical protein